MDPMRVATAAERNIFSVERKRFFSLSSKGEPFDDEEEGPHIVKFNDLATLIPSTGLGPLFLMHHESLSTVILELEEKKNMKVLVQKCIFSGYIDTGVADDLRLMHLDKGLFLSLGPTEQVIVAGLRILFYFGGTDIEGGLAGCQLYHYQDEITNIKVVFYFNGQRVMLSLIEHPGECSLYLYCED